LSSNCKSYKTIVAPIVLNAPIASNTVVPFQVWHKLNYFLICQVFYDVHIPSKNVGPNENYMVP
jgi:hypothetical protein